MWGFENCKCSAKQSYGSKIIIKKLQMFMGFQWTIL
jgi:hypothetical protein